MTNGGLYNVKTYTYDIWCIPGMMIPAADALMRCPELRWKHCQGTLYRHTEWVVQDSKEWLRKVAVAMQDVSCSKNIV